jgi:hypothetical protein
MKHYAGLDLSMESTQVCIVDESGRKIAAEKVDSAPEAIAETLKRYGSVERAVIETGRMSPAICLGLRELGVPMVCIDARQAHQSLKAMKANKTDPHDAAGLAQLAGPASTRRCMSNRRRRMACAVSSPHAAIWWKHVSGSTIRSAASARRSATALAPGREGISCPASWRQRTSLAWRSHRLTAAVRAELVEQIKEMDRRMRIIASQSQACEI